MKSSHSIESFSGLLQCVIFQWLLLFSWAFYEIHSYVRYKVNENNSSTSTCWYGPSNCLRLRKKCCLQRKWLRIHSKVTVQLFWGQTFSIFFKSYHLTRFWSKGKDVVAHWCAVFTEWNTRKINWICMYSCIIVYSPMLVYSSSVEFISADLVSWLDH